MEGLLELHIGTPEYPFGGAFFFFGALKMIDILSLYRIVHNLHGEGFQRTGRRGVIRKLTLWQGGFHALGESTEPGTEPPVSEDSSAIQFCAPLRFSDDTRFVKPPLTQWRTDVETRTLLRLVTYIDQYAKSYENEPSPLGCLRVQYNNQFQFELDLKVPVPEMDNRQLQMLVRELAAYTGAINGLLRQFEAMSGSEIQRLPSDLLKYVADDIVNYFDRISWRHNL
jgi:hypothetical protein